ncbi:MAG: hypothetical protein C4K47_08830 [Candidatus Thorarchaeota archaeon]|nr:MAG: hypothetical protein C4K47_08830 [Candidatus Thorarchaeota archaeon]
MSCEDSPVDVMMSSAGTWRLKSEDGNVRTFFDIRRKVGNKIIRAYLLKTMIEEGRVQRIRATLKGPKDEFKDFADFLVLGAHGEQGDFHMLVEAGVYENLRIVGTDKEELHQIQPDALLAMFTDALENPASHDAMLFLSVDSRVRPG